MSLRQTPLDELVIPDGTTVEEHDLVTDGDVIVGGRSTVEFGVRGRNVLAGESATFGGDIEAEADCRLDMWADVAGNVLVGRDAYLGERVHLDGQLKVAGDLDIGDDVEIDEGFEANGWIVIRNPMPTIVFLMVYLSQLLRMGEDEAAQQLVEELTDDEATDDDPLVVPRGGRIGDETWQTSTPARIGDDCRLHGNVRAESIEVGANNNVFGSLRAKGDVIVGPGTRIHGDLTTRDGEVVLEGDARVLGDVSCEDLTISREAVVDGTMRASGEVTIRSEPAAAGQTEAATESDGAAEDVPDEADDGDEEDSEEPAETTEDHSDGGASDSDEDAVDDSDGDAVGDSDGDDDAQPDDAGERPDPDEERGDDRPDEGETEVDPEDDSVEPPDPREPVAGPEGEIAVADDTASIEDPEERRVALEAALANDVPPSIGGEAPPSEEE